jgi:hypothetical protein
MLELVEVSSTMDALLKTFYPRHWVVLGGHVKQVESLEADSELLEKTGIKRA